MAQENRSGETLTKEKKKQGLLRYDEKRELTVRKGIVINTISWMRQWVIGRDSAMLRLVEKGPSVLAVVGIWNYKLRWFPRIQAINLSSGAKYHRPW